MNFENKIIVIDDFIDKKYQEKIKSNLLGGKDNLNPQFPWYYVEDVTSAYDPQSKHRPGLSHQYVNLPIELLKEDGEYEDGMVGKVMSEYHKLFIPLLKKVGFKLSLPDIRVLQGRSFLQFPVNTDGTIDEAHIDIYDELDFIVALYYVNDSDGDTVIYNEKDECLEENYTIKQKVTPKQGRVVIFDGGLFHAAEQPINSNTRCIVNYNLAI